MNIIYYTLLVPVIERAKRAPYWGVQSRFRVIYMCQYVCRGRRDYVAHAHAQSHFWAVKTDL